MSVVKLAMNHIVHIIRSLMGQRYAQHAVKNAGHCQFLFGKRNTQASSIHMLMNFCDFT